MASGGLELTLESDELRVLVLPDYGARVTSLFDKRSGREWLIQGPNSPHTGEDARYSIDEAIGWDECFPTVGRWDAGDTAWRRNLRDHGDLWGRPWTVEASSGPSLRLSFEGTGFRFTRTLRLDAATLGCAYEVTNTGVEPLPFMWALHALLATRPGERINMPGVSTVDAAFFSSRGKVVGGGHVAWPAGSPDLPFPLAHIQPTDADFMAKLYASDLSEASVGGDYGTLHFRWQGAPHIGIWLTYGAWPESGGVHHVALEPTTAPVGHLGEAVDNGTAVVLGPGASSSWSVDIELTAGQPGR